MGQSRLVSWERSREASRAVCNIIVCTAPQGLRPPPCLGNRVTR